jgi:two-component system phosphate regulon sensor histidine kinase PhoR
VPGPLPFRAMLVLADETSSKRAERMRADFLANASHELRTPLASLSGFIETIAGPARDDAEAQERFLGIMRDQTERMKRLIDDLLSLSRVEMNEHLPPSAVTDLAQLAADVIDSLSPVAAARSILIRAELPGGPALVTGDRDQLHEVVENLVENALKYSADGSSIRVSLYDGAGRDAAEYSRTRLGEMASRMTLAAPVYDAEARYAVIRVRDAGVGIDRRYLPRLSERFFRVDGQKSGPASGTGLGLAIVKHIVTRHRGGLTVESAPGGGSVFSVFFPKAAEPVQALEARESAE